VLDESFEFLTRAQFLILHQIWDPLESYSMLDNIPSHQMDCDAKAVANTKIDWWKTPEAHVFQAHLPRYFHTHTSLMLNS
jgi:hypothetical protein